MMRTPLIGLFLVLLATPAAAQQADDPEKYLLLSTSRTGTLQEELNAASPEYELVAMTVFRSRFGGSEAAAILEAEAESEP